MLVGRGSLMDFHRDVWGVHASAAPHKSPVFTGRNLMVVFRDALVDIMLPVEHNQIASLLFLGPEA